ncbi:MAG: flagellar hook protein FlgE [Sphingobium sp.]|nr:flagellar hook protein FlgE [Sphingobium sp.]MCI1271348.1 flagellar hook protein FlgE [Sphingobium sp.]MCI1756861.1 flagellar hook protein FlgE [Sphingobium sp.]MCI2053981.1 flagellar hook protein FlgE [Sphingobium sp.]
MSLYSALYAGVSGLSAQSSAMATVADNITNINTVGYKSVEAQFKSLVTDGTIAASYSAGGVAAAPHALISKQGLLQASSSTTDLGIDGAGFFVTRSGINPTDAVAFTRAGSFRPDEEGFLRNSAGYYLQGWALDNNGAYVNTGNLAALTPVRVGELTGTATATTRLQMRANLQSTTAAFTGTYAAGDMATGTVTPAFSRSLDIFDAQGGPHRINLSFLKTAPNTWAAEIYASPASDVTATNGLLASGTIAFNPDGSLDVANSSAALFGTVTPVWTNSAAADPIQLELGTQSGLDGLTQFGSTSAMISSIVNGGLLGNIASVEVSKTGRLSAIFEDGTARELYQLPLATFPNPDGLTRLPGNGYGVSDGSGAAALNEPTILGAGAISSGTLEGSTVDLAEEFTNMIRFQRAYSAASRIITTVDDMLQEVSNLKR